MIIGNHNLIFDRQGSILRNLSDSAYYIYFVHPPILVVISLGFASLSLYPIIKLAFVFPLTVILCSLLGHFVLKKIHMKKRAIII
ncbi:MAG: hypothetical protein ACFFCE_12145 [Promethearchaeota archaeon]